MTDDTILPDDHNEGPLFGKVVGRLGERGEVTVVARGLRWREHLDPFAATVAPARRHVSTERVSVARCCGFDDGRTIAEI